jgi:hypothetical protein
MAPQADHQLALQDDAVDPRRVPLLGVAQVLQAGGVGPIVVEDPVAGRHRPSQLLLHLVRRHRPVGTESHDEADLLVFESGRGKLVEHRLDKRGNRGGSTDVVGHDQHAALIPGYLTETRGSVRGAQRPLDDLPACSKRLPLGKPEALDPK